MKIMQHRSAKFAFALVAASILGCSNDLVLSPATGGDVSVGVGAEDYRHAALTAAQLHVLADWFSAHRADWRPLYDTTRPSPTYFTLALSDGRTISVFYYPNNYVGPSLMVEAPSLGPLTMSLSQEDAELFAKIFELPGLPVSPPHP